MQNVYPFSKFRRFMPEKNYPFFLISRIRANLWKIYEHGIPYGREWWGRDLTQI